jgi:hypothetical protein
MLSRELGTRSRWYLEGAVEKLDVSFILNLQGASIVLVQALRAPESLSWGSGYAVGRGQYLFATQLKQSVPSVPFNVAVALRS